MWFLGRIILDHVCSKIKVKIRETWTLGLEYLDVLDISSHKKIVRQVYEEVSIKVSGRIIDRVVRSVTLIEWFTVIDGVVSILKVSLRHVLEAVLAVPRGIVSVLLDTVVVSYLVLSHIREGRAFGSQSCRALRSAIDGSEWLCLGSSRCCPLPVLLLLLLQLWLLLLIKLMTLSHVLRVSVYILRIELLLIVENKKPRQVSSSCSVLNRSNLIHIVLCFTYLFNFL